MRGRTPWLHTSGCPEQRVASFHVFMPGSNPLFYQFVANPARLASPHSCCPPKLRTPLCHHSRVWNLSLALQRGVSWGAALISHPWQSMTFWWDHEYPVMHCLRHSVLELCGWSSKQQLYFLPCWMTSDLWTRWWPTGWVGVLLHSTSTLVDEMGRGDTEPLPTHSNAPRPPETSHWSFPTSCPHFGKPCHPSHWNKCCSSWGWR